ncbi:MAG TPA: hypothetical protein VJJ81_02940 [Candidatus Babeliales bacterium]|nr:hypothetical protein [Candidatus Babeliales bacterium]
MFQIEQLFSPEFWRKSGRAVYVLIDPEYSYLFCAWLKEALKLKGVSFINLDLNNVDLAGIKSSLAMSLLGQNMFFWLGDITVWPAKKRLELLQYLNLYTGPHRVVFFSTPEDLVNINNNLEIINLEQVELSSAGIIKLAELYSQTYNLKLAPVFLGKLTKLKTKLTLDQTYLLLHYMTAFGDRCELFFEQWLSKIVVLEQTLFDLSTQFFARKPEQFFLAWEKFGIDYTVQFWTAYWSEQLFRAYYFVQFQQAGDLISAKRIAYRLPFSFTQSDWRKFSTSELYQAHNFIRSADFELKSGSTEILLDLFYLKFFNSEFLATP